METIKYWVKLWGKTVISFVKHPILSGKKYIKDFKEADFKGKVKQLALTAVCLFACYYAFVFACFLLIVFALFGQAGYSGIEEAFRQKFGREPYSYWEAVDARDQGWI